MLASDSWEDRFVANFIEITDLTVDQLIRVLDRADDLQEHWRKGTMPPSLAGQRVGLWFSGGGFRTRIAFEMGARAMGADVFFIPGELGVHEPLDDIGHYLRNWFSMLVIRAARHPDLTRLASDAAVQTVNAMTDHNHPCEIIGDLQFIRRRRGSLEGLKVVFAGGVTNLFRSWLEAAVRSWNSWPPESPHYVSHG